MQTQTQAFTFSLMRSKHTVRLRRCLHLLWLSQATLFYPTRCLPPHTQTNPPCAHSLAPLAQSTPTHSAPHDSDAWPPRFHKLLLHFAPRPGDPAGSTCDFAYCDARRFGRVKLCEGDPAGSEAIRKLGFDVLLEMPDLQAFKVCGPPHGVFV